MCNRLVDYLTRLSAFIRFSLKAEAFFSIQLVFHLLILSFSIT